MAVAEVRFIPRPPTHRFVSPIGDERPRVPGIRVHQGAQPKSSAGYRQPRGMTPRRSRTTRAPRSVELPGQDSNLDKESQNLLCYRYTTGYGLALSALGFPKAF